jgi:hypothetical protein
MQVKIVGYSIYNACVMFYRSMLLLAFVHAEEFLYNPPVNYFMGNINMPETESHYIPALADSVKFYRKAVSPTLIAYKSLV